MNKAHNLKVFILAAGRGSRLMPLTRKEPKPLLYFFNKPILYHLLDQINKARLGPIMVNGHYLWAKTKKALDAYPQNKNITFSLEENKRMGTAGAYASVSEWRRGSDLLTINGDLIQSFDLQKLIAAHYKEKAFATMLLTKSPLPNETPVWCNNGNVMAISKKPPKSIFSTPHGFTGIQILSNNFIEKIPDCKPSEVIDFYKKFILKNKKINAHISNDLWFDLGSPEKYWSAHMSFLKKKMFYKLPNYPDFKNPTNTNWFEKTNKPIGSNKEIFIVYNQSIKSSPLSTIGPYVIISGKAQLGKNISLTNCLLLNNAIVRDHEKLENKLIDGHLRISINNDHTLQHTYFKN